MIDLIREKIGQILIEAGVRNEGTFQRLILFSSPTTHSGLAMTVEDILSGGSEGVRDHIRESDLKFIPADVPLFLTPRISRTNLRTNLRTSLTPRLKPYSLPVGIS